MTRRRHLHTVDRRVVSLDDDVLDLDAVDETQLTGEAALLASLRRGRTGRMGDIVATIQADQDRIIREDPSGILVVEGGPGTGKTVVALHRAAYLLYTYRRRLARRGILVIGPTATFLRYIDQVLPSLGENDVVLATIGSLFPGVDARRPESPEAARVKGDAKMAGVLSKAVTDLRQVPAALIEIKVDGITYRLTPRICGQARAEAEQAPRSRHRCTAAAQHGPADVHQLGGTDSWSGSAFASSAAGGSGSRVTRRTCAPNWPPHRPSGRARRVVARAHAAAAAHAALPAARPA